MIAHEKRIREALDECSAEGDTFALISTADLRALLADLDEARAALTAAKAGGWVAVPEVLTDEMRDAGNEWIGNRFLLGQAYAAMLAARPLPNPPKEQA